MKNQVLFVVKTLDEFKFTKKPYLELKDFMQIQTKIKKISNNLIVNYTLSNNEITKKFEKREDKPEFIEKIGRSPNNNIKDKSIGLCNKFCGIIRDLYKILPT